MLIDGNLNRAHYAMILDLDSSRAGKMNKKGDEGLNQRQLNDNYPNQWTGLAWDVHLNKPTRSPDISPNDVFCRDHLTTRIYKELIDFPQMSE